MRNVSARTPDQASYLAALGLFILMLVPHFLLVFKARADTLSALKRRTPTLFSQTLPPEFKGGPELVLGLVPNESATPFSAQTNHNLNSGNCTIEESATNSSTVFIYSCSVFANKDTSARLEMRTVEGGAVDFYATIQSYPLSHRLFAIGLALSVYEQDSDELALPIFGGHLIKNPASTILAHKAIQPGPGMSMQFFSYTSGKGGFLLQGTNPRGENLYTSTHTAGKQGSRPYYTGTFFEYVPDDKTRRARSWLFPYRLSAVEGDWFDAAKRYRSWVVENSLRAGIGILSNGRLEEQTKPLIDMLVIETLQPPTPAHLERIKRLKNVYGDDVSVWYFLWNLAQTKPQGLPYGHFGTYFPKLEFSPVLKELRSLGINVAPYTFPGAGSLDNPGILSHLTSNPPLESQTITNLDGSAAQILEAGQFPVVLLDFTPELVEYYKILAQVFFDIGFGGVYTDLPGIMWYDHSRDPGQESGVSSSYYENYRKMHASMREVFKKNGHHLVSGAEASFERLIPVVDMTLGMMLPKVFPGEKRTYPINLVEAVYKDFVQTLFADPSWGGYAYINGSLGPIGPDNHTMTWLLTEGAVKGRVLNSTQPLLYSYDYLMEEVTPGLVPDAVVYTHYTKMMKLLLKMQRRWKKFLKFGEALREPAVSGDQHLLDINTIDETGSAKSRESLQLYSISNAAFLHPQEGI
ncbi:MAG: hypothetical protein KDD70_13170, partial [Bdellovibrionales bacterium]|nr:hypothetical protein [Bdellovibrionales bacterium]